MQLQISCSMIRMAGIGILHDLRHTYMDKKDCHLSRAMGILILPSSGPTARIWSKSWGSFPTQEGWSWARQSRRNSHATGDWTLSISKSIMVLVLGND